MRNSAWFMAFLRRAHLPEDEAQLRSPGHWYATFIGVARSVATEGSRAAQQAVAKGQSARRTESETTEQVKRSRAATQRVVQQTEIPEE